MKAAVSSYLDQLTSVAIALAATIGVAAALVLLAGLLCLAAGLFASIAKWWRHYS